MIENEREREIRNEENNGEKRSKEQMRKIEE